MGRYKDVRGAYVTIRLLTAEKERLEAHAKARRVGLSDILREALAPILTTDPAPAGAAPTRDTHSPMARVMQSARNSMMMQPGDGRSFMHPPLSFAQASGGSPG